MAPNLIYHYTDVAGLYGIVESKSIWATDVWFMNDTAEATFGWQRIEQFLKSKKPKSGAERDAIGNALETMDRIREIISDSTSAIACFSKHGDSLSQWRSYGKDGGFSLGFSRRALARLGSSLYPKPRFTIRDVAYNSTQQDRILEPVYQKHVRTDIPDEDPEEVNMDGFMFVADAAAHAVHWLKHPAFWEESEVRLHTRGQPEFKTNYRVSEMGLTPYIPVSISGKSGSMTAIREIVIGPQRHPVEVMRALKGFLKTNGLAEISLRQSAVPLRL